MQHHGIYNVPDVVANEIISRKNIHWDTSSRGHVKIADDVTILLAKTNFWGILI